MSCFFVLVSFLLESCIKCRAEAPPPCSEAPSPCSEAPPPCSEVPLFVPTASSLHGSSALRTEPLPLRCFCQADTPIVEPLYWTLERKIYKGGVGTSKEQRVKKQKTKCLGHTVFHLTESRFVQSDFLDPGSDLNVTESDSPHG